jgi:hypothetical protein
VQLFGNKMPGVLAEKLPKFGKINFEPEEVASIFFVQKITKCFLIQSNLCTMSTLGTPNLWPLLTGGRCSGVGVYYKTEFGTPK